MKSLRLQNFSKEQADALLLLLTGAEQEYRKRQRAIALIGSVLMVPTIIVVFYLAIQHTPAVGDTSAAHTLRLTLLPAIFAVIILVPYFNLKRQYDFANRDSLKWIFEDPTSVSGYSISSGETIKITFAGGRNKATLISGQPELEIERAIFNAFPQLDIRHQSSAPGNLEYTQHEVIPVPHHKPSFTEVPACLRYYFEEHPGARKNLGCLPYIFLILFSVFLTSLLTSLVPALGFFLFKAGNHIYLLVLIPMLLFGFLCYSSIGDGKKLRNLLRNEKQRIAWIYIRKTKNSVNMIPTGTTTAIVIADNAGNKYEVHPGSPEQLQYTFEWLKNYLPHAVHGYLYEWENSYRKEPGDFTKLVNTDKNNE